MYPIFLAISFRHLKIKHGLKDIHFGGKQSLLLKVLLQIMDKSIILACYPDKDIVHCIQNLLLKSVKLRFYSDTALYYNCMQKIEYMSYI